MSRFVLTAQLQLQAPNNVAQIARQIQSQLNNVTVNVQVQNAAQAQRQLNNVTQSCNNATTAADRLGRVFGASIRRFAAFGVATRAVSLFTSTLANAVKSAIEFDRELVKVIQVSGATRAELDSLVSTVNRLSSSLGVSSRDVLEAGKTLVQAGVSFDDARIALDALAKSALAPNFDSLAETTEGAVAILAQFKQGVGALEGQLSSVNAVAGAFAVEASDLIDVVRRAGGVFKSSGGSLNELLALFTSVRATTRESAESIGTGLRTIFTRIQRPKTIEFLKQFGVQLTDLQGRFVGPFEAVRRLSDALAGLGEGDITFIRIAEELGGFRQIGKVLPLLQQFQTAQEALNVAQNAGTGLTKDALTAQQALAVRITKVKEEFLALVRSITETSTFQIFANTALNLASALIKLADALKPVIPLLTAVVGIRLARGFGNFAGGVLGGIGGARGFNAGGKVLHFAKGGLVPGSSSGPEDDIEARVSGGEFIMKREAVKRIGAGTLAAMNENRFNRGTTRRGVESFSQDAQNRLNFLRGKSKLTKSEQDEVLKLESREKGRDPKSFIAGATLSGNFGVSFLRGKTSTPLESTISQILKESNRTGANRLKSAILKKTGAENLNQVQYQRATLKATGATPTYLQPSGSQIFEDEILQGLPKLFNQATRQFTGSELDPQNVPINQLLSKSAIGSIEGQFFEAFIRRVTNNVIKDSKTDSIFDFNTLAASKKDLDLLFGQQPFILPNEFKNDASSSSNIASAIGKGLSLPGSTLRLFNSGGLIQKFAAGTMGRGVKQSKGILPRPGKAIDSLIKAGGGFVDVDRTLLRTVGDIAYAKARTDEQRQAVLQKYFLDPANRLKDIQSAGLTSFGKELQTAIKSGQLPGSRVKIVSKSSEVTGLRQYLSALFGIPTGNMTFTRGGSKVPFIQGRGPLVDDIVSNARFANGGMVPGTGNRDTVPAMLEEGSFVIKKSSVNSIGASTLASMPKRAGGGAGTGVPALVTPGEWIYSRKEAQSIGYGKLNTMNKLGKYANGGVVQKFANGTGSTGVQRRAPYQAPTNVPSLLPPLQQLGQAAAVSATNLQQNAQATNASTQANNNSRQSTNNAGLALSLIPATIQSFLPPIDESSSALAKLANSSLSMITALGSTVFALEAFGVSLNTSSVLQFLGGGGLNPGALQGFFSSIANFAGPTLARGITSVAGGLIKLAGPLVAATGSFFAVNSIVKSLFESFGDYDNRLKKAISVGNVQAAGDIALRQTENQSISNIAGGAAAGAAFGALVPIIGPLIGAAVGAGIGLALSDSADAAITQARSQAQLTKTQEALKQSSEKTAEVMNDLERGTITAIQALQATAFASQEIINLRKENEAANQAAEQNRDTVFSASLRNIVTLGGLLGESSGARNARIDKEIEDRNKALKGAEEERIKQAQPQLQVVARQTAAESGDFNAYLQRIKFADPALFEILIRQGTNNLEKQFNNIAIETKRAQESFKAMNLGLQSVSAAANAGVVGLNNYLAAQEFGNNAITSTISILEASITSAAQGISDFDFNNALQTATDSLTKLGATPQQIAQIQNNIRAVNTAQKQFPSALTSLKKTFEEEAKAGLGRGRDPVRQKELIGEILQKQLEDSGISEEARSAFKAQFDNLKLDEQAINQLLAGDLSVLEGPLKDIGEAALNQLLPVLKAQAEAQDTLNKVLRTKIELENKLVSAQRQRLDIELEAAEIAAKYGGAAVTPEIRRQNVISQANIQAGRSAPALRQGTADEFNRRNIAIETRLQQIANIRAQAAGEGPAAQAARQQLQGATGVNLEAEQQRLQELAKSDYETTKQLIKLKEDELQLIKEKNKLEQDSIQSLISGDIEKFFEQQAAVGATAAIATGNESLMRAFGADALAAAAQDIQRQQQAGVQSLFGQQLGGAGGLTERAFGAAVGARGIQDPRLAAIAAGTTAEEVSLQKDIVDLAGTLTNYGDVLVQSADNELNAATLQLQAAQLQLDAATQRVQAKQVQAQTAPPLPLAEAAPRRFGGLIYASTGKFINFKPRGTDTVPAMLTPGEFVVRREAVQRGNNLAILKSMNNGQSTQPNGEVATMNRGGVVRYRSDGSTNAESGGGFGDFINKLSQFTTSIANFNQQFSANIDKLNNTSFTVKLDASNINVNLTGTSFLGKLKEDLQNELFSEISRQLGQYQVGDGGKLKENRGILNT